MVTRGTRELSEFLRDWATPHLRAAGYRKSHHTFRRISAAGDQAGIQFRGYALGVLGSFLLDVWVVPEPWWDLVHFDPDGTRPFPARPATYDAAFHWQQGSTVADASSHRWRGAWQYDSVAERDQVGHHLQDLLRERLLPDVDLLLDREEVRRRAASGTPVPGALGGDRQVRVAEALTVTDGTPAEVDALLRTQTDPTFQAWAHARLLDGPTWRSGAVPPAG